MFFRVQFVVIAATWYTLPELRAMSALKALNYVAPSVITPELTMLLKGQVIKGRRRRSSLKVSWIRFILLRSLALIVG